MIGKGGGSKEKFERREKLGKYGKVKKVMPHAYEVPGPDNLFGEEMEKN